MLQYNKRDLPNAVPLQELKESLNPDGKLQDFEASAQTGEGVFDTLKALARLVLQELKKGSR